MRVCAVCTHELKDDIEKLIGERIVPQTKIAKLYELSITSIKTHAKHLPAIYGARPVVPSIYKLGEGATDLGMKVVDKSRALQDRLMAIMQRAAPIGEEEEDEFLPIGKDGELIQVDYNLAGIAALAGKITEAQKLEGTITGEIPVKSEGDGTKGILAGAQVLIMMPDRTLPGGNPDALVEYQNGGKDRMIEGERRRRLEAGTVLEGDAGEEGEGEAIPVEASPES